jgi:LPXTG-site transpeptidase (sortase) family protein
MSKPHAVPKSALVALYRQALIDNVPLDSLDEKVSQRLSKTDAIGQVNQKVDKDRQARWRSQIPMSVRLVAVAVPTVFLSVGLYLLASVVLPIAGHMVSASPQLQASALAAPIPREDVIDVMPPVVTQAVPGAQAAESTTPLPTILDVDLDYTNLSNWFAQAPGDLAQNTEAATYVVEIPKLNIEKAEVKVGGTDLNGSLIQYPGTAQPGQVGAPVIFGHSVLRQFYNPKVTNPKRYTSIFSTIMTLKEGDLIYVTHDNVKYTYKVRTKSEVKPEDTFILAQRNDSKLLKLVTCTPEGTYLRRGVVTAELVESK